MGGDGGGGSGGGGGGGPGDDGGGSGTLEGVDTTTGEFEPREQGPSPPDDLEEGEFVYDESESDDSEWLVVERKDEEMQDIDAPWDDDLDSLADVESNQPYPDDDRAVELAPRSSLEGDGDGDLDELSTEELQELANDVRTYTYPESRLERENTGSLPGAANPENLESLAEFMDGFESVEDLEKDIEDAWAHGGKSTIEEMVDPPPFIHYGKDGVNYHETKLAEINERQDQLETVAENPDDFDAVVIHDMGDADGLMSSTLYKQEFGDDAAYIPSKAGEQARDRGEAPGDFLVQALEETDDDIDIYVADLAIEQEDKVMDALESNGNDVFVRDHHGASEELGEAIEANGGEYTKDADAPAAAGIVAEKDISDETMTEELADAVEVTKIADSFQDDHERWDEADTLRTLQYQEKMETFEETVGEQGMGFLDGPVGRDMKALNRVSEIQTQKALETTETIEHDGVKATVTYAGSGDRSSIASEAQDQEDVDLAFVITNDSKISARATEENPHATTFAEFMGGGGRDDGRAGSHDGFDFEDDWGTTKEDHRESRGEAAKEWVKDNFPDMVNEI